MRNGLFVYLSIGGLFVIGLLSASPAYALCDVRTGPKLAGRTDDATFALARREYDEANSGCVGQRVPVTVLVFTETLLSDNYREQLYPLIGRFQANNFRPIIRMATAATTQGFPRISTSDAALAGQHFNALGWPADTIVYFGNEVNLPTEWVGAGGSGVDDRVRLDEVKDVVGLLELTHAQHSDGGDHHEGEDDQTR